MQDPTVTLWYSTRETANSHSNQIRWQGQTTHAHWQHIVSICSSHDQHMISTWSAHGQHMISTWSDGQMVSTWFAHGSYNSQANDASAHCQQIGSTCSPHDQHMVAIWSTHDQHMASTMPRQTTQLHKAPTQHQGGDEVNRPHEVPG